MCELLVALPEVTVLGVDDKGFGPLRVHVESLLDQAWCRGCGARAAVKDRPLVEFVDLPCFGRPTRLVWHKHRWSCREPACPGGSWTVLDHRIAAPRAALTDRPARSVTLQVGKLRSATRSSVSASAIGTITHASRSAVYRGNDYLLSERARRLRADVSAVA